jgi:hypothetical protein
MTDPELVAKKLAFIETCVREMRTLARPERIADDLREERFVEHTLQLAIQAALDVGSHVVSDERLGEPETSRDVFRLLGRAGVIPAELTGRLVLERDRAARIRFEVRSRNQYFDLAPIRRLYRRYPAPASTVAGKVAEPRP